MSEKVAAGYIRVSTPKQREDGSHERQESMLREWAESNGYELSLYRDIAESGQDPGRESYNDMMENLEEFDAVVVRELSRLGRMTVQIIQDLNKITREYELEFHSLKEKIDTSSAMGRHFIRTIASLNELQADLARERTIERYEQAKANGDSWGRPEKLDREKIKELIEMRNDKGLSYSALAKIYRDYTDDGKLARSTVKRYCDRYELQDGSLVRSDDE